jgi:hypothetical protein
MSEEKQQMQSKSDLGRDKGFQPANNMPEDRDRSTKRKMPALRTWLGFALILLLNYLLATFLFSAPTTAVTIPYTLFKEEVGQNNVARSLARARLSPGASRLRLPTLRLTRRVALPRLANPKR